MPHRFWKQFEYINASTLGIQPFHLQFPVSTPLIHHLVKTEGTSIVFAKGEGSLRGTEEERYQSIGHGRKISPRGWTELYRGYLGCLSFTDNELGRLFDIMDARSLWESTVVVFTADHGMHLGEKVSLF